MLRILVFATTGSPIWMHHFQRAPTHYYRRLGLTPHRENSEQYVDETGAIRFVSGLTPRDRSHALIDQHLLETFWAKERLKCVWGFVAGRSAWLGGENDHASKCR